MAASNISNELQYNGERNNGSGEKKAYQGNGVSAAAQSK